MARRCRSGARRLRFATLDSTIALMFALTINASLLILAAAAFHHTGRTEIAELGEAHTLLQPILGSRHRTDAVRHRRFCAAA